MSTRKTEQGPLRKRQHRLATLPRKLKAVEIQTSGFQAIFCKQWSPKNRTVYSHNFREWLWLGLWPSRFSGELNSPVSASQSDHTWTSFQQSLNTGGKKTNPSEVNSQALRGLPRWASLGPFLFQPAMSCTNYFLIPWSCLLSTTAAHAAHTLAGKHTPRSQVAGFGRTYHCPGDRAFVGLLPQSESMESSPHSNSSQASTEAFIIRHAHSLK